MAPQSAAEEAQAVDLLSGPRADRALLLVARALGLAPRADRAPGLPEGTWALMQLNHRPGAGVTGVFTVSLRTHPAGVPHHAGLEEHEALLCLSTAALPHDAEVVAFSWGEQRFSGWLWPDDPWLPGLREAAQPSASLIADARARVVPVAYRPTRRAVFRVESYDDPRPLAFIKVLRPRREADLVRRHCLLADAQVPVPRPLAATGHGAVAFPPLIGPTAAAALRAANAPRLEPEHLVALLDRFPEGVLALPRHPSWTDRVVDYTRSAGTALPTDIRRIDSLATAIADAAADVSGDEDLVPTHGDFHPGNVILGPHPVDPALGPITGLLDLDSVGPGRLSDDLSCFVAHTWLLTDDARPCEGFPPVVSRYVEAFGQVVDPTDLRIRIAGVLVSLIGVAGRRRGRTAARRRLALAEAVYRSAL